jgi:hypothetical protein
MNAYQMQELLEAWVTVTPVDAHDSVDDLSTAEVMTPPEGATQLLIQAIDQAIRYTIDGTTPTASIGFRMVPEAEPVIIRPGAGGTITLIEETAGATAQYQWLSG